MAAGFNPFKKLFGPTGPQAISAASAAGARNNPAYNVTTQSMMSQPYPDRILKHQAAKNAGWNPDWRPDPYVEDRINMLNKHKNDALSPTGSIAAQGAKGLAGEPAEFEYITKELDRDFIQEAMASALGGAPELPGSGPRPPAGSQPQPGDFATLIPSPIPRKKKKGPY